jgi:DNA-directed RNA polymerase specialized sigma24 family protein
MTQRSGAQPDARGETNLSEFHRLIEQQIPRLRRYARALPRNRERAGDLVQDTLGRANSGRHGPLPPVQRPRCSPQAFGYGGTPFFGGSAAGSLMLVNSVLG